MEFFSLLIDRVADIAPALFGLILGIILSWHAIFFVLQRRQHRDAAAVGELDQLFEELAVLEEKVVESPGELRNEILEFQRHIEEIDEATLTGEQLADLREAKLQVVDLFERSIQVELQTEVLKTKKQQSVESVEELRVRVRRRDLTLKRLNFFVSDKVVNWLQTLVDYLANTTAAHSRLTEKRESPEGRFK